MTRFVAQFQSRQSQAGREDDHNSPDRLHKDPARWGLRLLNLIKDDEKVEEKRGHEIDDA